MKVTVKITENFKKEAKPLLKKYHSLAKDLQQLEQQLTANPQLGAPLGNDAFKIRLKIASKGKGKSGGARVISLVETVIGKIVITDDEITVYLLSIYDKSDVATITDKELRDLIKTFHSDK